MSLEKRIKKYNKSKDEVALEIIEISKKGYSINVAKQMTSIGRINSYELMDLRMHNKSLDDFCKMKADISRKNFGFVKTLLNKIGRTND